MRHSAKDNYVYLTTAPVPRLIVSLAVPTIISMLVTSFYNMADTYFVGKINTQSTAAVGIVFSVMSIIQADSSSDMVQETIFRESWVRRRLKMPRRWRQQAFSGHCLRELLWL